MSKRQQRLGKADRAASATAVRDLSTIASTAQMPAVNPNNQTPADMAAWANAFFGPGVPRQPIVENEQPRQFDYPSGINLQIIPRSGFGLIPFYQLRAFADTFEYVRVVIEAFKREIRSLEWDIQALNPTDDQDYGTEIQRLRDFWRFPDRVQEFDSWLNSVLEDMLVLDAVSLWIEMDGAQIGAVEQIDGTTIRPLLDARGRIPAAPTPAYAQVIKGIDWLWMNTDSLLYRPFNTAVNMPYGTSPTEFIMTTVNTTLRRQMAAMVYWDQTNIPEALVGLPERWTQEQIKAYQEYFDALLAGNYAKLRRIKFMPTNGANLPVHEFRRPDTGAGATAQDEWALKVCCWAFGLSPSEFGLVNGQGLGGKGFMEGAENALYRFGIGPVIQYLQNLISGIIARQTAAPLCFRFTNIGPSEDRKAEAELMERELRNGVIDVNVWRQKRGQEPIDNAEPFMVIGNAPVLLRDIFKAPAKQPAESEGDAAPVSADIQQLAMNGAQVSSLVELVTSVSASTLAPESAIQIILNAFPSIPEASVRNMINAAKGIEPPTPAPAPPQLVQVQTQPAQPEAGAASEEPNPDDQVVKLALGAWREKCVKRVKDGKAPECDPPTLAKGHIPSAMAERIKAGLREGSIDAAFELVKKKSAQSKHVTPERDRIEEQFAKALRTALKDVAGELPDIKSEDDARDVLSDDEFWGAFRDELEPVLTEFIGKGAAQGITEVRTDERFQVKAAKMAKAEAAKPKTPAPAVTVDWDLVNDQAQDWARAHSGELLTGLEANTKSAMGELIADWIERGEPTSVLSTQFIVLVNDPKRAELIAVTEITRAFAQGNTEAWKAQGVEGRKWFTSEDELVCPICGDLAGSVARLGDDFEGGVDNPPAHPRCRCWVQPVEVVDG